MHTSTNISFLVYVHDQDHDLFRRAFACNSLSDSKVSYCQPHQGAAREVFPIKIKIPWQTWKMFPQCEFDKLICAACSDSGGSPWLPQYWPLNCSSHHPRPSHSAGITITNTITPIQLVLLFLLLLLPFSWYCYFLQIKTLTNPTLCSGEQQFHIRRERLGAVAMVDPNPAGWSSARRPPLRPPGLHRWQEVLPARLHLAGHTGLAADGRHLPRPSFCLSTSSSHWQSPHWACLCRWNLSIFGTLLLTEISSGYLSTGQIFVAESVQTEHRGWLAGLALPLGSIGVKLFLKETILTSCLLKR